MAGRRTLVYLAEDDNTRKFSLGEAGYRRMEDVYACECLLLVLLWRGFRLVTHASLAIGRRGHILVALNDQHFGVVESGL